MPDDLVAAYLAAGAGRGATIVVLGATSEALRLALVESTGATGLVIVCEPNPEPAANRRVARVRAAPTSAPIASHIADLVLLTMLTAADLDAITDEARRLLAPRGDLRAALPAATADADALVPSVTRALTAASFRTIEISEIAGAGVLSIRARGP